MEDWLKQLGTWFTNATMTAAVADAPAVTAASGWSRNKDGSWDLKDVSNPGVIQLRDNLATLSGLAYGAEIEPLLSSVAKGLWNIGKHPVLTSKAIINIGKQGYNYAKDLWWLAKKYNNVGTGLSNSHVRRYFLDLAKNPTLSRNFIQTYSNVDEAGLTLNQIKEAIPQLRLLEKEYGIIPKAQFNNWDNVSLQIGTIKDGLSDAKRLIDGYTNGLDYLKSRNKVLYDIAKESPLYLDLILADFRAGTITNLEQYVKDLIKLSGTFLRRMDLPKNTDAVDAFSKIRGHTIGEYTNFSMDVGNPNVVNHPLWSRGYGNTTALYTPKEKLLLGPVETWWSLRFPKFKDPSIAINPKGIHTGRELSLSNHDINAVSNFNSYLKQHNIPESYGRTNSHTVFLSPNKGATIADLFDIQTIGTTIPRVRYSLGYKKGGKLNAI